MSAPEELVPESDAQVIQAMSADIAELRKQVADLESEHELTAALSVLDAVKEVALFQDAPGALRATDALTRLLYLSFNLPAPKPVLREGGMVDAIFGRPTRAYQEGER